MNPTNYPDLDPDEIGAAISAFRAENCPFCDVTKDVPIKPFCDRCLELLTPKLRADIWDRTTYLHTFHPAIAYLKSVSGKRQRGKWQAEIQTSVGASANAEQGG